MIRCNQCWTFKDESEFLPARPHQRTRNCASCRKGAREGHRVVNHRTGLPTDSPLRFTIIPESKNRKLGPIPEVYVTASTCPDTCSMFNAGCYGESGLMREHWRNVEHHGVNLVDLCEFVAALPAGTLWRYAVVGDLPGRGALVDLPAVQMIATASHGRRGFTFTHKYMFRELLSMRYDQEAFTINLSADNLAQADELARWGPTVSVVPSDTPTHKNKTPAGRTVVVCPATYDADVTCSTCRMCANPSRKSIIGFPAHGLRKREVSGRARLKVIQ